MAMNSCPCSSVYSSRLIPNRQLPLRQSAKIATSSLLGVVHQQYIIQLIEDGKIIIDCIYFRNNIRQTL